MENMGQIPLSQNIEILLSITQKKKGKEKPLGTGITLQQKMWTFVQWMWKWIEEI